MTPTPAFNRRYFFPSLQQISIVTPLMGAHTIPVSINARCQPRPTLESGMARAPSNAATDKPSTTAAQLRTRVGSLIIPRPKQWPLPRSRRECRQSEVERVALSTQGEPSCRRFRCVSCRETPVTALQTLPCAVGWKRCSRGILGWCGYVRTRRKSPRGWRPFLGSVWGQIP